MTEARRSGRPAQQQFGRQAYFYAQSNAHRGGEGLEVLTQYLATGTHDLIVDVGTGAGFTAFAAAPFARRVLATDITPEMLRQTRAQAKDRGVVNVDLVAAEAESLPFDDGSVDVVTCRQAAHHFHDLRRVLSEVQRVLKVGGAFIFTDPAAPEGDTEEEWMNDVEARRDLTHVRDLREAEWRDLLAASGFVVTQSTMTKVYLEFNDWVRRAGTPRENVVPLRTDFLAAPEPVVKAFGIRPEGDDIHFHWDVLVTRAAKR